MCLLAQFVVLFGTEAREKLELMPLHVRDSIGKHAISTSKLLCRTMILSRHGGKQQRCHIVVNPTLAAAANFPPKAVLHLCSQHLAALDRKSCRLARKSLSAANHSQLAPFARLRCRPRTPPPPPPPLARCTLARRTNAHKCTEQLWDPRRTGCSR